MDSADCRCNECGTCKHDHGGYTHMWRPRAMAMVTLFKPSGKFYTEEEWRIPSEARLEEVQREIDRPLRDWHFLPTCMRHSEDYRRINGGAILVQSQEPWGYPHLFPGLT